MRDGFPWFRAMGGYVNSTRRNIAREHCEQCLRISGRRFSPPTFRVERSNDREYVCVCRLGGTTPAVYILTSISYFILVKNCLMPVGVEDGRIPAEAFTASSYHSASFLPNRGRLNLLPNGGKYCWAAKQNNANQWLQVRNDSPGHL